MNGLKDQIKRVTYDTLIPQNKVFYRILSPFHLSEKTTGQKHQAGMGLLTFVNPVEKGTSQNKYGVSPKAEAVRRGASVTLWNAYENRCVSIGEQIAERTISPRGTLIPVKTNTKKCTTSLGSSHIILPVPSAV